MCLRQVSKIQKTVLAVVFYFILYLLISNVIHPGDTVTFVSDDIRVGDKYVLIFLVSPLKEVFSDADGANVFKTRGCGWCFITNNKGFLPYSEYDAIVVHGKSNLSQFATMNTYVLDTSRRCIVNKLKGCPREPVAMSISSRVSYHLCGLCQELHKKKTK